MENLIVASSNLVAILPLISAAKRSDYLVFGGLFSAMFFSSLYHAMETEKHQFPGLFGKGFGKKFHKIFINCDRISAILAIITVLFNYHQNIDKFAIQQSVIGITYLMISELKPNSYWVYILTHCLWHIMAFGVANYLIK